MVSVAQKEAYLEDLGAMRYDMAGVRGDQEKIASYIRGAVMYVFGRAVVRVCLTLTV